MMTEFGTLLIIATVLGIFISNVILGYNIVNEFDRDFLSILVISISLLILELIVVSITFGVLVGLNWIFDMI